MKKRCWTNPKTSSNKPEVLEIDKRPSHDIPHLATGVVAKMLNGIMEPCRPENIIQEMLRPRDVADVVIPQ
jgi:hypothetical protein